MTNRTLPLLLCASLLILILAACAGPLSQSQIETAVAGTEAARVTNQPCKVQAASYIDQLAALDKEWADAYTLAGATSRGSLSPQIANLQAIKRKIDALSSPKCAWEIAYNAEASTDRAIKGFLSFLSQESDSTVKGYFDSYRSYRQSLLSTIDKIMER